MRQFGLYPSAVTRVRALGAPDGGLEQALENLFRKRTGAPDGLALTLLIESDPDGYVRALEKGLGASHEDIARPLGRIRDRALTEDFSLTGAEAVALHLGRANCQAVFAYPGTSELALCDAFARSPYSRLINSRGDKEAAFMAAGSSMESAGTGTAILHGARGLTNAGGGIADARRNEHGFMALVGLPSLASERFLPPHGEPRLLEGMGTFAKSWHRLPGPGGTAGPAQFLDTLSAALREVRTRPYGPVLVGLHQDIAEAAWLPYRDYERARQYDLDPTPIPDVTAAVDSITDSTRVVALVDDYFLRYPDAEAILAAFCEKTGAVVFQVRYQRGPMLFDRINPRAVPAFLGWLDPTDGDQRRLLHEADLLVTLEDRNMYPRVVGALPPCRKLAITSAAEKVRKNDYLADADVLVEGDVAEVLRKVTNLLPTSRPAWVADGTARHRPAPAGSPAARETRDCIGRAIAAALAEFRHPVLVDDGQMFGGLLAEVHDRFPERLRIYGDHGGFVGAGISYATGCALGTPEASVLCSLGDEAFGNGMQGLIAAVEQQAPVTFLVCCNGGSVSLTKQASSEPHRLFDDGAEPFLVSSPVTPFSLSKAIGMNADRIDFTTAAEATLQTLADELEESVRKALNSRTPHLIELRLAGDSGMWEGIWLTAGFDERPARRQEVAER